MFTGIITDVGSIRAIARQGGDARIEVATAFDLSDVAIGASIACSGVCLTVVEKGTDTFTVDASAETLSRTTLGAWREGTEVNLERALRLGDELGGHLVSGHVDGVGLVRTIEPIGESRRVAIEAPAELARFIAEKGSVAVDGVSLTVNEVDRAVFAVNIIPHTWAETVFRTYSEGSRVNLEIDLIARYVARLNEVT